MPKPKTQANSNDFCCPHGYLCGGHAVACFFLLLGWLCHHIFNTSRAIWVGARLCLCRLLASYSMAVVTPRKRPCAECADALEKWGVGVGLCWLGWPWWLDVVVEFCLRGGLAGWLGIILVGQYQPDGRVPHGSAPWPLNCRPIV